MIAEHGLAYTIQIQDRTFLFDTGGMQQTFMHNISAVQPDIKKLDTVILSHGHHDHVGGLMALLNARKEMGLPPIDIYCHPYCTKQRYVIVKKDLITRSPAPLVPEALLHEGAIKAHDGLSQQFLAACGARLVNIKEPVVVYEDDQAGIRIITTGEISRVHEKHFYPESYLIDVDRNLVKDEFLDDQGLIIEKKGDYAFLFLGCCHAGLENTVERTKSISKLPIKAIIGGFHLSGVAETQVREKIAFLERVARDSLGILGPGKLILRPTHCSGEIFYLLLKNNPGLRELMDIERLPVGTEVQIR
nr:MBL fold metallo-hydrolase [Candidatus Sigynarchaeota archaeon]